MPEKRFPRIGNMTKRPSLKLIGQELAAGGNREPKLTNAERAYFDLLHEFIDQIFTEAESRQWTWSQFAKEADLSYMTICSLGDRLTKWPRFATICKMAHAVGWELSLVERKGNRTISMRKTA